MRTQSRWMKWILEEATSAHPPLPWERGSRQTWQKRLMERNDTQRVETA